MAPASHKGWGASPAGLRRQLEAEIERLIDMLDQIDGEPDLEDSADDEPSFGGNHYGRNGLEPELEGDTADSEPFLGWTSREDGNRMTGRDPEDADARLDFNGEGCQQANALLQRRRLPTVRLPVAYRRYVD